MTSPELFTTLCSVNHLIAQIKGIMQSLGMTSEAESERQSAQIKTALSKLSLGHTEDLEHLQSCYRSKPLFTALSKLLL